MEIIAIVARFRYRARGEAKVCSFRRVRFACFAGMASHGGGGDLTSLYDPAEHEIDATGGLNPAAEISHDRFRPLFTVGWHI